MNTCDVAIIGGGAAGLAAATVLARTRSSVVVIDAHKQSNRVSPAAHAVFTRDGTPPDELYAIARQQLLAYPNASVVDGTVASVTRDGDFVLTLASGETVGARYLLLAQGMTYSLPPVEGLQALWGTKAWHCPYCHGYESADKRILAIAGAQAQKHLGIILPSWTREFSFAEPEDIASVRDEGEHVIVALRDGSERTVDEILVHVANIQRDAIAESLGCEFLESSQVKTDQFGKTSADRVFAAGDQASPMTQVNIAVASGHMTGISIHRELCQNES